MTSEDSSPTNVREVGPRRRSRVTDSRPARMVLGLFVSLMVGLAIEAAVRVLRPDVFCLGVPSELYELSRYGDSPGWRPGATGDVLGSRVAIDQNGCRLLPAPASAVRERWLILGDSVAFGMGVDADKTFAAGLQDAFEGVQVLNAAVVGYGAGNFAPVLGSFLSTGPQPDRVLFFFTLNDASYDWTNLSITRPDAGTEPAWARLVNWAGTHVRAYQLLKGLLLDRSRHYYLHDVAPFEAGGEQFERTVDLLVALGQIVDDAGLPMDTYLLPYEAQLRQDGDGTAQALLGERLEQRGMRSHDLVDSMRAAAGGDSASLFLFADAMHLSEAGHAAVLDAVVSSLSPTAAPDEPSRADDAGR